MAQDFQNILVMKSGRVIEQGNWDQLNKDGNELYELVKSE